MNSRVLIAGHSQAKYFAKHLKRRDVDVLSFSGFRIEQMWEKICSVVHCYSMIVLHVGANNLWNDSPAMILRHYQNLVENIWATNSTCRVIISGLLPRGQNRYPGMKKSMKFLNMVNRKADLVNRSLRLIAQSYPRLHYVGHTYFVVNGKLQGLLSTDGLHINWKGTASVVSHLEMEIGRLKMSGFDKVSVSKQKPAQVSSPVTPAVTLPTPYRDALLTPVVKEEKPEVPKERKLNLTCPGTTPDDWPLLPVGSDVLFQIPVRPPMEIAETMPSTLVHDEELLTATPSTTVKDSQKANKEDPIREKTTEGLVQKKKPRSTNTHSLTSTVQQKDTAAEQIGMKAKYNPGHSIYFKGSNNILSNFYPCPIRYNNVSYSSVEHAYQYQAAIYHSRFDLADQIFSAPTAAIAKTVGKSIRKHRSWHNFKQGLISELVQLKFDQVPEFSRYLLKTKGQILLHNVADNFWGTGRFGGGRNFFGKLLMKLRDRVGQVGPDTTSSSTLNKANEVCANVAISVGASSQFGLRNTNLVGPDTADQISPDNANYNCGLNNKSINQLSTDKIVVLNNNQTNSLEKNKCEKVHLNKTTPEVKKEPVWVDDVQEINEVNLSLNIDNVENEGIVLGKNVKSKSKKPQKNYKNSQTECDAEIDRICRFVESKTISNTKQSKNACPTSSKKPADISHQIIIDVYGNKHVFLSKNQSVLVQDIKQFLYDLENIPHNQQNFYTLKGVKLNNEFDCSLIQNIVLQVKAKGGGKRGRKGPEVHPDRICGPCTLCNETSPYYTHLAQREDKESYIVLVEQKCSDIQEDSCICKNCDRNLNRELEHKVEIPKKSVVEKKLKPNCFLSNFDMCDDEGKRCITSNSATIGSCFNLTDTEKIDTLQHSNIKFCIHHDVMLRNFERRQSCIICNFSFDFHDVKRYLNNDMLPYAKELSKLDDKSYSITPNDPVCRRCHRKVSHFKDTQSFDDKTLRNNMQEKCSSLLNKYQNGDFTDKKLSDSVVYICSEFLNDRPVLLQDVFDMFYDQNQEDMSATPRSLLNNLILIFNDVMSISTVNQFPRLGTMLKMVGSDDTLSLHKLLHDLTSYRKSDKKYENLDTANSATKISDVGNEKLLCLLKSAKILHDEIRVLAIDFKEKQLDKENIKSFDAVECINDISPVLWNFFSALMSNDRTSICDSGLVSDSELKKLKDDTNKDISFRKLFTICLLVYQIDDTCQYPLHLIISDIIDKYSNSSKECFQILNKFGICISKDTHLRHQNVVIEESVKSGPGLDSGAFTVASADNINKRSCYAAVKSSDSHRGFDGTSVQLAQPNPKHLHTDNGSSFSYIKCCGNPLDSFLKAALIALFNKFQMGLRNERGDLNDIDLYQEENSMLDNFRDIFRKFLCQNSSLLENLYGDVRLNIEYLDFEKYLTSPYRTPNEIEFKALAFLTGSKVCIYELSCHNQLKLVATYERPDVDCKHSFHILQSNEDDEKFQAVFHADSLNSENLNLHPDKEDVQTVLQKVQLHNGVRLSDISIRKEFNIMFEKPINEKNFKPRSRTVDESLLTKKFNMAGFPVVEACKISNAWGDCSVDIINFNELEKKQFNEFGQRAFTYCCQKYIVDSEALDIVLPSLQSFLERQNDAYVESSTVHYLCVLDENADSKDTMKLVLDILYSEMNIGKHIKHLVVVGDGKTYDHLIKLKDEYGDALSWLLPFPGDWHALKNYQSVLMKIYLQAGLKELIELYHFGATATSVCTASNFEKTHNFLLQCWEAMYRYELSKYFEFISGKENISFNFEEMKEKISESLNENFEEVSFSMKMSNLVETLSDVENDFYSFTEEMCSTSETWKYWHDFIHNHCFVYVCYFLAIRSANWDLRCYCVKHICRLLQITDSKYYARLLPQSVVNVLQFPLSIIENFKKGGFALNILGRNWHFQGLDEGHESCINRDVKQVMNAVSKNYLSKIIHYLPYRATVIRNIKQQLGMMSERHYTQSNNELIEIEKNIHTLINRLKTSHLFVIENDIDNSSDLFDNSQKLRHIFKDTLATDALRDDALNMYQKGEEHLKIYINSCFRSGNYGFKINKTKKLFTFESKKPTLSKFKRGYKDQQLENKMLRKLLAWSKENNVVVKDIQQFISLPRAITDSDGLPYKSAKSKIIDFYKTRYPKAFKENINISEFECVVIDGMFILNTSPLKSQLTFTEYFTFLYSRWIAPYYESGVQEVHLVFDHQLLDDQSPKVFERVRRDQLGEAPTDILIELNSLLPRNWRKFLQSRKNKKQLINLLALYFLEISKSLLLGNQIFVTGGGFENCCESKWAQFGIIDFYPDCRSNISEGDSLVWLHSFRSKLSSILIYCPDNDTYHIGLPLVAKYPDKNVCVMLKLVDPVFLDINLLSYHIQKDSDLHASDPKDLPFFFQMIYISTGCDYISFFKDHSKRAFTETFIKNIRFINSGTTKCPGNLSCVSTQNLEIGFLSFVRLIGCEYFKKCASAFIEISDKNFVSGEMLFNHMYDSCNSVGDNHKLWLSKIRDSLFSRVQSEEYFLPSYDALWYHWLRSCWVCQVWLQADKNDVDYPSYTNYGWTLANGKLGIIWDSPENLEKVDENIKLWTTGCGCLKTMCKGNRCKCKREKRNCGPGCKCGSLCMNKVVDPNEDEELIEFMSSQYSDSDGNDSMDSSESSSDEYVNNVSTDSEDYFDSDSSDCDEL